VCFCRSVALSCARISLLTAGRTRPYALCSAP